MSKIGVIGSAGVVGSAVAAGLLRLGHQMFQHDIALGTKLSDVLDTEAVYLCVPTEANEKGDCDISIVERVVSELVALDYKGFIVIKSTVSLGTTQGLIDKFQSSRIGFQPEILRERSAFHDFQNQPVCVIGSENQDFVGAIKSHQKKYVKEFVELKPTQAELFKYFSNCYNAVLITLANSFASVADHVGVDYTEVKEALLKRGDVGPHYLASNLNFKGFAGKCIPKDLSEMANFCKRNQINVDFFANVLKENSKYKRTVPEGMRLE